MAKSFKLVIPAGKHHCRPGRPITLPGERGEAGPPGPAGINITLSAQCNSTVTIGCPLYTLTSGNLDKAIANQLATSLVIGLAANNATAFTSVNYEIDGVITSLDWQPVTGETLLSPGTTYYLDPNTAGKLTSVAPVTGGALVVKVGTALNTISLNLEISPPILL